MKIVKAQKQIKRLKGEIAEIQQRISSNLSTLEENEFEEDIKVLMGTLKEKVTKLIELKVGVMKANIDNGKFTDILNLGELKSRLEFLRGLNPVIGTVRPNYGEGDRPRYKAQIQPAEKLRMVEECQQAINELTDKLDDFNAVTDVTKVDFTLLGF